ncbi:uncharacterized protein F5891DRAFT_1187232 [Suillus fuscotomentosus]|uniref:Ubiquitin-like protease family profile domain-containing protein n=1 Tax=Suillus fuscotomentosus TaxID=1912939 RepID=A0AAD4E8N2_9AGAM|nr:uncharacterized protein F5891DRAFT_1187232 [Suillus fuscotomentosus]KAG1901765.1 hypothetical protein F5891DRAFT_1187232 [Suillus fuscotomentosus]
MAGAMGRSSAGKRVRIYIRKRTNADLGDWVKRRIRGIKTQSNAAQDILTTCGVSIEELRLLWAHQQCSQLSIHAPAHLKKELDTVLALQADMVASDQALQTTRTMLEKETALDDTMNALDGLEKGHQCLMEKVEALYASLNIHDRFPELQGVNLDFQLQPHWATPFVSTACFSSCAKEAADLSKTLTRGATETNLSWINHPLTLEIDNEEDDIPDFEAGPSDVDTHQIAFVDFLEEDSVANEDIEDIAEVGKASVTICWVVPEVLQVDRVPVPRKDQSITVQQPGATRIWASRYGFPRQIFDPRDISFLGSPTARLNDHSALPFCLLMTSHISNTMHLMTSSGVKLPGHIIRRRKYGYCPFIGELLEFHLFDSFAEERPWQLDIKAIMTLVSCLLTIARQHHPAVQLDLQGWHTCPLMLKPLQTNGYDCRVWVLAGIMAVLQGFHLTGLCEDGMESFRHLLYCRVIELNRM